jgi:hypothetical protein
MANKGRKRKIYALLRELKEIRVRNRIIMSELFRVDKQKK